MHFIVCSAPSHSADVSEALDKIVAADSEATIEQMDFGEAQETASRLAGRPVNLPHYLWGDNKTPNLQDDKIWPKHRRGGPRALDSFLDKLKGVAAKAPATGAVVTAGTRSRKAVALAKERVDFLQGRNKLLAESLNEANSKLTGLTNTVNQLYYGVGEARLALHRIFERCFIADERAQSVIRLARTKPITSVDVVGPISHAGAEAHSAYRFARETLDLLNGMPAVEGTANDKAEGQ